MAKHAKERERQRMRCAANMLEPIAKAMIERGKADAFKASDRKAYLQHVHGLEMAEMVYKLRLWAETRVK